MANETQPTWWTYVQTKMDDKGWTTGDLTRASGIDRSRFSDWRHGKSAVSLDNARATAHAFGAPLLEVLVAAGLLTAAEADLRTAAPDPAALSDEELLAELARRVKGNRDQVPSLRDVEANPARFETVEPRQRVTRAAHKRPTSN